MLKDAGRICSRATDWGMPVLAMVYARGPKVGNEYDPKMVAH
jgi:class I fructose-bisphosphate aldolase